MDLFDSYTLVLIGWSDLLLIRWIWWRILAKITRFPSVDRWIPSEPQYFLSVWSFMVRLWLLFPHSLRCQSGRSGDWLSVKSTNSASSLRSSLTFTFTRTSLVKRGREIISMVPGNESTKVLKLTKFCNVVSGGILWNMSLIPRCTYT